MATATKRPTLVKLSAALKKLGVARTTFQRHWSGIFTPITSDGGHHRIASDELEVALKYMPFDAVRARAAVVQYRLETKRDEINTAKDGTP